MVESVRLGFFAWLLWGVVFDITIFFAAWEIVRVFG
jgi:hypothetical protein